MATPLTKTIPQYTAATTIDANNDQLLIYNNAASAYRKINLTTLLSITGSPVGTTDTQTLSSKTLTSPTINGGTLGGAFTGTYSFGGTPTFPSSVVSITGTQTLTNKTLTSPTITGGSITNTSISVDSISGATTSTIVTVGGVQMNNGVIGTSGAVTSASIAPGAVQPQGLVSGTGTGWSWTTWTPTLTNLTVGNGTYEAKYIQVGKTVFGRFFFVLGSSSSVGTAPTFSTPTSAVSAYYTTYGSGATVGFFRLLDAGSAYTGSCVFTGSNILSLQAINAAGTYATENQVTGSVPATWGAGSAFFVTFTYETV